jgi:hypothetical protein
MSEGSNEVSQPPTSSGAEGRETNGLIQSATATDRSSRDVGSKRNFRSGGWPANPRGRRRRR